MRFCLRRADDATGIAAVRRLNESVLPVRYTDGFYDDLLKLNTGSTPKFLVLLGFATRAESKANATLDNANGAVDAVDANATPPPKVALTSESGPLATLGVPAGAIVCRRCVHDRRMKGYVATLVVLEAFRGRKLATSLVKAAMETYLLDPHVTAMFLHTQVGQCPSIPISISISVGVNNANTLVGNGKHDGLVAFFAVDMNVFPC